VSIIKFAIPSIYSLWEGYIKFVFLNYIQEINSLNLSYYQLHENLLTHAFDIKYPQFTTGIKNEFYKKREFFENFLCTVNNKVQIDTKLPTHSNINWKVINELLERFNMNALPKEPFDRQLSALLEIRNRIAHGENAVQVSQNMVNEHANNVKNLMYEIMNIVIEACQIESYRK